MKKSGTLKVLTFLLAGSFFFSGALGGRVARGVTCEGVSVGGMTYARAEKTVLAELEKRKFLVRSPAGAFSAPLSVGGFFAPFDRAEEGETMRASYRREWADMEDFLYRVCEKNAREAVNAAVCFSADGFAYTQEQNGVSCDYTRLQKDAERALRNGKTEITLYTREYPPSVTIEMLKERTALLARFSTSFDGNNLPRAHNIALAAERVAGTIVEGGGEFSFNRAVGERTKENGFEVAAVIQDGEFLPGVGGGVCQASTTLFNAALRAGMKITESRPHSLSVGYAAPSLDAMVSSASDLKFVNPYGTPVYILGRADGGEVFFELYGLPDGKRYETESVVLLRVPPPAPKFVEGETAGIVRAEKDGIASESFLLVYEGETLISRTRVRRDTYAAVQGILRVLPKTDTAREKPLQGEENLF